MSHRYTVRPCDNLGTIEPKPPRDRTWLVWDSEADSQVDEFYTRREARAEAKRLNQAP